MADQGSNNKSQNMIPDQKTEYEADELLRREREELSRNRINLLGVFSAYVLLVGTGVGFGVFAYYTGTKSLKKLFFIFLFPYYY